MKAIEVARVLVELGNTEDLNKELVIEDGAWEPSFIRWETSETTIRIIREELPYEQFPYGCGPRTKPTGWDEMKALKSRNLWPTGAGDIG